MQSQCCVCVCVLEIFTSYCYCCQVSVLEHTSPSPPGCGGWRDLTCCCGPRGGALATGSMTNLHPSAPHHLVSCPDYFSPSRSGCKKCSLGMRLLTTQDQEVGLPLTGTYLMRHVAMVAQKSPMWPILIRWVCPQTYAWQRRGSLPTRPHYRRSFLSPFAWRLRER